MVSYILNFAAGIMYCNPNIKVCNNTGRIIASNDAFPSLYDFINVLIRVARDSTPTLFSTLVYLTRLRLRLSAYGRYGYRYTVHRIFLSALILTLKYLHDGRICEKIWTSCCNESADSSSFFLHPVDVTRLCYKPVNGKDAPLIDKEGTCGGYLAAWTQESQVT